MPDEGCCIRCAKLERKLLAGNRRARDTGRMIARMRVEQDRMLDEIDDLRERLRSAGVDPDERTG